MEEKKTYTPGRHDRTEREKHQIQDANINRFNSAGIPLLLSRRLLDSIGLLLIPFVVDGKIGFINKLGETVVKPEYDTIKGDMRCEDSLVAVCKDNVWNVINCQGEELLKLKKKVTSTIEPGYDCPFATIQNQKESKVINVLTNKYIVDGGYDFIDGFRHGFARVRKKGLWGVINEQGQLVVDTKYSDMYTFYDWDKPTTVVKEASDGHTIKIDLSTLNKH